MKTTRPRSPAEKMLPAANDQTSFDFHLPSCGSYGGKSLFPVPDSNLEARGGPEHQAMGLAQTQLIRLGQS